MITPVHLKNPRRPPDGAAGVLRGSKLCRADANGDGGINLLDLLFVRERLNATCSN